MTAMLGSATGAHAAQVQGKETAPSRPAANWPADPTADYTWNAGTSGVADIQFAFNQARANENSERGTSVPVMTLPAQGLWSTLSDGARVTWLFNRERIDRGVMPIQGEEWHVTTVAQTYAQYLFSHNVFNHTADGRDPWQRIDSEPTISACHDALNVSENLSVFATTGNSIPLGLERAVYLWLYTDSGSSWGHRHAALYYPYNDNSGPAGREGFLGIGRFDGGPYQGPFPQSYNFAEIVVLDMFDPCPAWNYNPPALLKLFLPLVKR